MELTTKTYTDKQLVARCGDPLIMRSANIAANAAVLAKGTVLGRLTAIPYNLTTYDNFAGDGSEKAIAVLGEQLEISAVAQSAVVYYFGVFLEADLVGLNAAAKTDFAATYVASGEILLKGGY